MTEKLYIQTFFYVWIYLIIVSAGLWIFGNIDLAIAFFLGALASVMMMSHNYKTTMKTAYKDPEKLKVIALRNYFFRYAFYIIIVLAVYFREQSIVQMVLAFFGIASFKIVLMLSFLIGTYLHKSKDGEKND